ncbi:MAG TPA: AraC family transcriptional regulator [Pedobacter sp.]
MDYRARDLFLMSPQDLHDFNIENTTEFFFLRFNDIYLKSSGIIKENIHRLEYTLHNARHVTGSLLKNETDKTLADNIIESIIREQINRDSCWDKLTLALVNALIVIVARNIEKYLPERYEDNKEEKALDILQYIHNNIYHPHLIKVDNVSREFGISVTYLGRYFKKHTGKTMQDYIAGYKMKLVENRLLHSSMRIAEIVEELGFADESHLNKFFKKQKGINPSEFRKPDK